jgi:NADP-dependent 3-hydroxy acid dehydrogenase YdfG
MVPLPVVKASNALISSTLSPGLVAIFVGGTSGIGETTLKQFVKSTAGLSPHAYIIGRNEANAKRITAECQQLNPSGSYEFLKGDVSLIKVVDQLCERIKQKEKFVNVLFLSAGDAVLDRSCMPLPIPIA